MMKPKILILIFLALIFIASSAYSISALSCGDTINQSITLTEDLSCSGAGIVIDADNVVINGNNHVIEGDGTGYGIYILQNKNIQIRDITVRHFEFGIGFVDDISGSEIFNSTIEENDGGVLVAVFGNNNKIHDNTFKNNARGLAFTSFSDGNQIYNNKFIGNTEVGIRFLQSKLSSVWNNKFIENKLSADDPFQSNLWDNGSEGNYWDDFEKNAGYPKTYIVNGKAIDHYPFWFQAKCGDLNNDKILDALDVAILIDYIFRGGEPPAPKWAADINGDKKYDIIDVSLLINHVFRGGSAPSCGLSKVQKIQPIKTTSMRAIL